MNRALQDDFSGGIWLLTESRAAPANTMADCVNGLLDERGAVRRRGGAIQLLGTSLTMRGLASVDVAGGARTLIWSNNAFHVLAANDSSHSVVGNSSANTPLPTCRPGALVSYAVFPTTVANQILLYAGSRKAAVYSTGTVTTTSGSKTVTGSGTAWLANADPGIVLRIGSARGIVQTVVSDTELTLREPFGSSNAGVAYDLAPSEVVTHPRPNPLDYTCITAVGTPGRVVAAGGSKAYFSANGDPLTWDNSDYHELPVAGSTLGVEALDDRVYWFTNAGVWAIGNMNYDLTDDYGNVQHTVRQINKDLILWGEPQYGGACGVVGYNHGLIVPATDGVYVMSQNGSTQTLSDPIRPFYLGYVALGYVAGHAGVFRGHYLLPIVNRTDNTVADVLVCHLATGAWTRWDGLAKSPVYTGRGRSQTSAPKLLGANGTDVMNLTGCFDDGDDAAYKQDSGAGGTSAHQLTVVTRAFANHPDRTTFWKKLRIRYRLSDPATDNPTITAEWTGNDGLSYNTLTGSAAETATDTALYGTHFWPVSQSTHQIQFRIKTVGAASTATLRSIDVFSRVSRKP